MKNNVLRTYKDGLCSSCGVCIGTCPIKCISYGIDKLGYFEIKVNQEKCTECYMCLDSCPGEQYYIDTPKEALKIFGFSTNYETRKHAASGGIVSEFISFCLENEICSYALTVKKINREGIAQSVICSSPQDIYKNKGSKYIPTQPGSLLWDIRKLKGSIIIVGLPCQIFGLKAYLERINKGDNVKFYLSLFCNHIPSFKASDFLLHNLGISEYEEFYHRGGGWPGFFEITTKNKVFKLPYRQTVATGFGQIFHKVRCDICDDPFGDLSDAAFADCYFLSDEESGDGYTFGLIRNPEISSILCRMREQNRLYIQDGPDDEKIHKAFKHLFNRKDQVAKKSAILTKIGRRTPAKSKYIYTETISILDFLKYCGKLFVFQLGKYKILWKPIFTLRGGRKLITSFEVKVKK